MKKIIFGLLLLSLGANAQTDTTRKTTQELGLGVNLSGGNNPLYGGTFKYNFACEQNKWSYGINSSALLNWVSTNDNTVLTRREISIASYVTMTGDNRLRLLFFGEFQHSLMRLINKRIDAGIGPAYRATFKRGSINCSECILIESTDRYGKYTTSYTVFRASTRIHLVYKTDYGTFTTITMVQPAIYNSGNSSLGNFFIVRSNNRFDFITTKTVALGISGDFNFEKFSQFLGVKTLDWTSAITFTYKITK